MKMQNLTALKAAFLEFTPTKGALRHLKIGEKLERASAVTFQCPGCRANQLIAYFQSDKLPEFIDDVRRYGRLETVSLQLKHLSLDRKVECGCGFQGNVVGGQVHW